MRIFAMCVLLLLARRLTRSVYLIPTGNALRASFAQQRCKVCASLSRSDQLAPRSSGVGGVAWCLTLGGVPARWCRRQDFALLRNCRRVLPHVPAFLVCHDLRRYAVALHQSQ